MAINEIEEYVAENDDMQWVFSEGIGEWGEDDRSFIRSDENMYQISNRFPNILFTLKHEMIGDVEDGLYTEYWLGGSVQREKLQYFTPEFDVNKLRER
nr:hypothetical protein [uncultured Cellulosilyticum sp.]